MKSVVNLDKMIDIKKLFTYFFLLSLWKVTEFYTI